jgi:hypothetical protein
MERFDLWVMHTVTEKVVGVFVRFSCHFMDGSDISELVLTFLVLNEWMKVWFRNKY